MTSTITASLDARARRLLLHLKAEMFREVALPEPVRGRLFLHSMPGRYETIAQFLSEAERLDLDLVVCLASENEIRDKSPAYFAARSERATPFSIRDFPIQDHGAPPEEEMPAFEELVGTISSKLRAGKLVLIHCWMGIGRTGTVATCVLLELGLEPVSARHLVWKAGSAAEALPQRNLIARYSSVCRGRSDA